MRIAVSATALSLEAEVDPRFGRCLYFVIVDSNTMDFETFENQSIRAGGGAGVTAAQDISNRGVQIVLTGNCGPNAYEVLSAAGVRVVTGVSGNVRDAIEAYKAGRLQPSGEPSVRSKFGMG